jgi:hypothetical protein
MATKKADKKENISKSKTNKKDKTLINNNDSLGTNNIVTNQIIDEETTEVIKPKVRTIESLSINDLRKFKRTGIMPK